MLATSVSPADTVAGIDTVCDEAAEVVFDFVYERSDAAATAYQPRVMVRSVVNTTGSPELITFTAHVDATKAQPADVESVL